MSPPASVHLFIWQDYDPLYRFLKAIEDTVPIWGSALVLAGVFVLTYHYIGHFSRFLLPGAKRIGHSRCDDKAEVTAAKNPDGSLAVVLLNRGQADVSCAIRMDGQIIRITLPSKTISTICIA